MTLPNDLTFLAPPGEAADWRMVLLCEAAPTTFHDALAANATKVAPEIVDVWLLRFPNSRSMLDLGGLLSVPRRTSPCSATSAGLSPRGAALRW